LSHEPRAIRPQPAGIDDVTDLDSPLGRQAIAIYEQSFPLEERDPVEDIAAELAAPGEGTITRLRALAEGEKVLGFALFSSYARYHLGYLKFLAVDPAIRGRGLGPILLRDALRRIRVDGRRMTGWPHLGLVLEVERPECAESDAERDLRSRRIGFYLRNGASIIERTDFIAPPVADGQPSIPFHLMVIPAVPKYRMHRWLRPRAVEALLVEGYDEPAGSWYLQHALEVRNAGRGQHRPIRR
jgi:ribosomal protein S18 acetylase RimI-like enzyme